MLLFSTFCYRAGAQVSVVCTAGTTEPTVYSNLYGAFTAINNGTHRGSISILINADIIQNTTASLAASGTGSASYSFVQITPSGSRFVTGTVAGPVIELNGADNVVIDGLNAGGNTLTIINGNSGVNASAIQLISGANGNAIRNLTLKGASTNSNTGIIQFGLSTGGTAGNSGNTIETCDIGPVTGQTPAVGIYSIGGSGFVNTDNTITYNKIHDLAAPATPITGIFLAGTANLGYIIIFNKIYNSTAPNLTAGNIHRGILIAGGAGHIISENVIGFANAAGTGTMSFSTSVATRYIGIDVTSDAGVPTSIQGNTIGGISVNGISSTTSGSGVLCGINIAGAGDVTIGDVTGNTIGSATGASALTAQPGSQGAIVGINIGNTGTAVVTNNSIGGLVSAPSATTLGGTVIGIGIAPGIYPGDFTIAYNTIGNSTANNMRSGQTTCTGASQVWGISAASMPDNLWIQNNTIQNLTSYGTGQGFVRGIGTTSTTSSTNGVEIERNTIMHLTTNSSLGTPALGKGAAAGIVLGTASAGLITFNTIHDISNTNTTATDIYTIGIAAANIINTGIVSNSIYDLRIATTAAGSLTAPPVTAGIYLVSSTYPNYVINNMISLGSGTAGNPAIAGIMAATPNSGALEQMIYNNSIYITGTASGIQPSFGFLRGDFSGTEYANMIDLRNNLITNNRSGGTGNNYAIGNNCNVASLSASAAAGYATDYNILNAATATIGCWGTAAKSFAAWKTATAADNHSFSSVPITYTDPTNGDLHLNAGSCGADNTGITINNPYAVYDYDYRGLTPDIGADEFTATTTTTLTNAATGAQNGGADFHNSSSAQNIHGTDCGLIATVTPSGALPVADAVTAKVTEDATVQSYNGIAYATRHYDIAPAYNAATATATVTLYYTQADFDAYNAANGTDPDLPTTTSNSDPNIGNLRITQYHGTGTAPGNYSGTTVSIIPASTAYQNGRWQVTFPVTGFSGFYLSGNPGTVLPLRLESFTATADYRRNRVNWEMGLEATGTKFEIARSGNGSDFKTIGMVDGNGTKTGYTFYDEQPLSSVNYYRLCATAPGTQGVYSNIAAVRRNATGGTLTVTPVPATTTITVTNTDATLTGQVAIVTDMQGREVYSFLIGAGQDIDVRAWPAGIYLLHLPTGGLVKLAKD